MKPFGIVNVSGVVVPLSTVTLIIARGADALKYLGLSKPGSSNYKPNGKYRIKTRGAFQTRIEPHVKQENIVNSWTGYDVQWNETGGSTPVLTNVASVTATVAQTQTPDDTFNYDEYETMNRARLNEILRSYGYSYGGGL